VTRPYSPFQFTAISGRVSDVYYGKGTCTFELGSTPVAIPTFYPSNIAIDEGQRIQISVTRNLIFSNSYTGYAYRIEGSPEIITSPRHVYYGSAALGISFLSLLCYLAIVRHSIWELNNPFLLAISVLYITLGVWRLKQISSSELALQATPNNPLDRSGPR
jgi:hypothetical protein